MNPTIENESIHRSARRETSPARTRRQAAADAKAPPPRGGLPYAGERAIATAYVRALNAYPYFRRQTHAALAMMIGFAVLAAVIGFAFGVGNLVSAAAVAFCAVAAIISGYHWYFKKWGPGVITGERYEEAARQLADSGDIHAAPLPLLSVLMLVGIMLVDGFLSASSLTTTVFAEMFTPGWAIVAAVGWSIGATYLLTKVILSAAMEAAINERRTVIRNLAVSSNPEDRAHAVRMKKAVGGKLLNDYDTRSNRYTARIGLAIACVVLAGATFVMRTNSEPPPAADPALAPTKAQPAVLRS